MGCRSFGTKNVHEWKRQNRYVKKKLWNLHWSYALHGKEETKQGGGGGNEERKGRMMSVDGHDLTIYGSCQGYMDFFSEVFCVVSFFLLYIFAHQKKTKKTQKHQDGKCNQRLKERTNT